MSGVIHLKFDESAKVPPSDSLGNLGDLGTEVGIVAPARVSAWTGSGRRFVQSATNGLIGADQSGNGTLLQRDVTIQALVSLTLAGATGPQTIIARGTNDGTASERYAYGLELQEQAAFPGFVEVRWFWQDTAGTIRTQPPGVFQHAGDGAEVLLTATRRWESSTHVVLRYYVNDQLIAEFASPDGDIAGGTTGRTTTGARKASGAYGRYLSGVIDELLVTDDEMSLEEIRHTWLRLAEYQPGGVEALVDLLPPGVKWFRDPGSDIGRVLKVAGQLLGLAAAAAEAIRALTLPDAAPLDRIVRWERICELAAAPGDSLDVRRARVIAYLQRAEGFQLDAIRTALAGPMDLRLDQVQIIEYTNTVTDDFSAGIAAERWLDGSTGSWWSTSAGELQASVSVGTDLRWESRATPWLLMPREPGRMFVQAKLSSVAALPQSVFAGIAVHNRHSGDWVWFGVYNNAGTLQIGYRTALAGQPGGAVNALATVSAGPVWLRISTSQAPTWVDDGSLTLTYSTTSPTAGLVNTAINSGHTRGWLWAGFALYSTVPSTPAATTVRFDDWFLHDRDSRRPFCWYAYRDPSLPGHPDMIGAHRLVQKTKPAYTHAAAITSKSLLYGSGLYGVGPMGGGL